MTLAFKDTSIVQVLKQVSSDWISEFRLARGCRGRVTRKVDMELPSSIREEYFVTSNDGLYWLRPGRLTKIFDAWTMGIGLAGDDIYLACAAKHRSMILRGSCTKKDGGWRVESANPLYDVPTSSSNQRIHQVHVDRDRLVVANTARNTVMLLDRHTGALLQEVAPFRDVFGKPILYDQNHINSVSAHGDTLLFVAYRGGDNALIGAMNAERLHLYKYENPGVHDILVDANRVIFSDTFGPNKEGQGGWPVVNGEVLDPDYFQKPPGYIVRGIASRNGEMLMGHSHKGERKVRFEGRGSLLVAREGRVVECVEMPFSQIYDIMHVSGEKFDGFAGGLSFDEVCERLRTYVGPPLREEQLAPYILPEKKLTGEKTT